MKKQDINTINQTKNRIRLAMLVAGIVIAVICSLALVYEAQQTEHYGTANGMIEMSMTTASDFSIQFASKAIASVMWPF